MDDKKKDLIPIAAIVVFLVIIIMLCVIRLNARSGKEPADRMTETQTLATEYGSETMTEAEKETQTAAEKTVAAEKESKPAETKAAADAVASGKDKEDKKPFGSRTISGNDPFAGAEGVNKTNEEMLLEMAGYWEQDNMEAVSDLAHLPWFMKMSASIADEKTFYYYGERNAEGKPHGTGVACYADNSYYYGEWDSGRRQGQGEWVKYYMYYDDDTTSDRAYKLHMYMGEWADNLPNGDGQDHYELEMHKAAKKERYIQNVIGTFKDGFYSGEMYLTTLNWDGNQEEWNGLAEDGIWSPYGAASNGKEIPICQDVDDSNNYLWIPVRSNKDKGVTELLP